MVLVCTLISYEWILKFVLPARLPGRHHLQRNLDLSVVEILMKLDVVEVASFSILDQLKGPAL